LPTFNKGLTNESRVLGTHFIVSCHITCHCML